MYECMYVSLIILLLLLFILTRSAVHPDTFLVQSKLAQNELKNEKDTPGKFIPISVSLIIRLKIVA